MVNNNMRQLTNYVFNEKNSEVMLDKIINNKHNTLKDGSLNLDKIELLQIKDSIMKLYRKYYMNKEQLYRLSQTHFTNEQKSALIKAYDNNPINISNLRQKYIDEIHTCPYCSIGAIKQLDHYMPKEKFPEFSVMDMNLVPCCSDCNADKWDKWSNVEHIIFNPFLHNLPECSLIKARLSIENTSKDYIPAISFFIDTSANVDDDCLKLVISHCSKLKLINENGNGKYVSKSTEFLTKTLISLKNTYKVGLRRFDEEDALKFTLEFLDEEIRATIERLGINHWETALLNALSDSRTYLLKFFESL